MKKHAPGTARSTTKDRAATRPSTPKTRRRQLIPGHGKFPRDRKKTVVKLSVFSVESPLFDGAKVYDHQIGIFTNVAAALKAPAWVWESEGYALRYYCLDVIRLDDVEDGDVESIVLDGATRKSRGIARFDSAAWDGLPRCRLKPGTLVGYVSDEKYCIGILLARPPGPKEAVHLKLEGMDCAALVGLPNLKTTPKGSHEHDHIPAALLFPVRHRVRKTLRQALQRAYKVYVADVRALARKRAAKQARDAHATPHPKASGIVSASPGRSTRR